MRSFGLTVNGDSITITNTDHAEERKHNTPYIAMQANKYVTEQTKIILKTKDVCFMLA
jgi:hypothetical protein